MFVMWSFSWCIEVSKDVVSSHWKRDEWSNRFVLCLLNGRSNSWFHSILCWFNLWLQATAYNRIITMHGQNEPKLRRFCVHILSEISKPHNVCTCRRNWIFIMIVQNVLFCFFIRCLFGIHTDAHHKLAMFQHRYGLHTSHGNDGMAGIKT